MGDSDGFLLPYQRTGFGRDEVSTLCRQQADALNVLVHLHNDWVRRGLALGASELRIVINTAALKMQWAPTVTRLEAKLKDARKRLGGEA